MGKKYDVAAYIWPSYTGDEPRTRIFWPEGYGEWQTVKNAEKKLPDHDWPRKPLWGYVNEADPYVMEMEIQAAIDHGVNVFIYDWYWYDKRPFLEQCLNNGFLTRSRAGPAGQSSGFWPLDLQRTLGCLGKPRGSDLSAKGWTVKALSPKARPFCDRQVVPTEGGLRGSLLHAVPVP